MSEENTLEEYKKVYFEVYKEKRKKSFFLHLIIYFFVNTASIILNLVFTPKFLWVIFPIVFWGMGVTWNYLNAVLWIEKKLNDIT